MAKSAKALREQLRRDLLAQGQPLARVAAEIGKRLNVRPRVAWRYASGWPQWKLVQEFRTTNPGMAIAESRVSEWESWPHGGTKPSPEILAGLALTFGHGCTVADLVDENDLEQFSAAERQLVGGVGQTPETAVYQDVAADQVRRAPADTRRRTDAGLLDAFHIQLETAKVVDGRYGAAVALPSALGVVGGLRGLAADVPDQYRGAVLALGAEAAEFTGWLFRDLADAGRAAYWYDQAMEYAQLGGDLAMQGYVLIRKAQMAYDERSGHRVRALAQAALDGPWRLPGHLHAEAALQRLKGQAMCGQDVNTIDVVQRARDMSGTEGALMDLREASCWAESGQPERAAALYDGVLTGGGLSLRDHGFFNARRSSALAKAGEPQKATEHALDALSAARETGSRRTENVLRGSLPDLAPWSASPAVKQLLSELSPVR